MINDHDHSVGGDSPSETTKTNFLKLLMLLDEINRAGTELIEGMRPAGSSGVQVLVRSKDVVRLAKAVKAAGAAAMDMKSTT